jgi:hypothetical protein
MQVQGTKAQNGRELFIAVLLIEACMGGEA